MKFAETQLLSVFGQVLYRHAEIVSGAYRFQKTQQGTEEKDERGQTVWRELTDDEKLEQSMTIMRAQLHRIHDLVDHLGMMGEKEW